MSDSEGTFEFLSGYAPQKVIAGAYYTLRLIKHRAQLSDLIEGISMKNSQLEPLSDERNIALKIIKEIEKSENVPVLRFSERRTEEYSLKLSKLIEESAHQLYGRNREEGRQLLAQLRTIR